MSKTMRPTLVLRMIRRAYKAGLRDGRVMACARLSGLPANPETFWTQRLRELLDHRNLNRQEPPK